MKPTYEVKAWQEDGWWLARVVGASDGADPTPLNALTQARTLTRIEPMARDLIATILDADEDSFDVAVEFVLPDDVGELLCQAKGARAWLDAAQDLWQERSATAARVLADKGYSLRETAALLGLSHQRVDQILTSHTDQEHPNIYVVQSKSYRDSGRIPYQHEEALADVDALLVLRDRTEGHNRWFSYAEQACDRLQQLISTLRTDLASDISHSFSGVSASPARVDSRPHAHPSLRPRGVAFWPVGTGDSTTIVVDDRLVMQVDLHDMADADVGHLATPVIDRLAATLPTQEGGNPYLAVFALTHADLDHCCGFGDLLDSQIVIGELWATPQLWRERMDAELCEDVRRFRDETLRRVAATLKAAAVGGEPASGDRIRIIGYDEDREDHPYADLPDRYFTFPGQAITSLDGTDVSDRFEAFIHAPFRDDCAADRNETSLAMQVTLHAEDGTAGRLLLLGDLSYITLKKIFDYSEYHQRPERLAWDVMLAAHHCSKKVMYAPGDDGQEELKQDLLDQFERHAGRNAYVIASSLPFRDADAPGDTPPHLVARDRYEEIVPNPVVCTGEYPDCDAPRPVVFGLKQGTGLALLDLDELQVSERGVHAMKKAGGSNSALLAALGCMAFASRA